MGKQTPFYHKHLQQAAKIVEYAGYDMPVQYSGIVSEHQAVRSTAGLFDVSHMGEFLISGPSAQAFLQYVTVNDVTMLTPGRAQYSAMCDEDGGIIDDVFIYMTGPETWLMVVNASNLEKDLDWLTSHLRPGVNLKNISDTTALLALQGPASGAVMSSLTGRDFGGMKRNRIETLEVAGQSGLYISSTGYTGESGFELYIDTAEADAPAIWDAMMEAGKPHGLVPAGLGARDTLRLEMGYPLYGNDLSAETSPLEAGINWVVKTGKGDFIGRDALLRQLESGVSKKLTGFIMDEEKQIPRPGYDICDSNGKKVGSVTSGTQSVTLGKGIGMGYLLPEIGTPGETLSVRIRRNLVPATVVTSPFTKTD